MTTLAVAQRLADRIADKLELDVRPRLAWYSEEVCGRKRGERRVRPDSAHCHLVNNVNAGLICVGRQALQRKDWRWLIAHEVTHLKVANHNSPTFLLVMRQLGYAKTYEKGRLIAAGKVRCSKHSWLGIGIISRTEKATTKGLVTTTIMVARCRKCGKELGK